MDLEAIHDAEKTMQAYDQVQQRARSHTVEDVQGEILKQLHKNERKEETGRKTTDMEDPLLQEDGHEMGRFHSDASDSSMTENTLEVRWEFRKILSYWSIVAYIIGCLMFSAGCIFAMLLEANVEKIDEDARNKALVTYPFVVGSTCFFIGSYISWFRIINKKYKGKGVVFYGYVNSRAFVKASLYLSGGFFYVFQNYNKIAQNGIEAFTMAYDIQVTLFLSVGSTLQFFGSIIDLDLNRVTECNFGDFYFWACWGNLIGCFLFGVGSYAAWFTHDSNWVNVPYLVGSIFFAVSSWIYLWVWKKEQWVFYFPFSEEGQVNLMQQLQLMFYLCSLALAICVFVFYCTRNEKFDYFYILVALFGILFNIGLLQLANALLKMPEDPNWGYMLMGLRLLSLIFFASMIGATANVYDECYWETNEDC